jgi:hypothetical protein
MPPLSVRLRTFLNGVPVRWGWLSWPAVARAVGRPPCLDPGSRRSASWRTFTKQNERLNWIGASSDVSDAFSELLSVWEKGSGSFPHVKESSARASETSEPRSCCNGPRRFSLPRAPEFHWRVWRESGEVTRTTAVQVERGGGKNHARLRLQNTDQSGYVPLARELMMNNLRMGRRGDFFHFN